MDTKQFLNDAELAGGAGGRNTPGGGLAVVVGLGLRMLHHGTRSDCYCGFSGTCHWRL